MLSQLYIPFLLLPLSELLSHYSIHRFLISSSQNPTTRGTDWPTPTPLSLFLFRSSWSTLSKSKNKTHKHSLDSKIDTRTKFPRSWARERLVGARSHLKRGFGDLARLMEGFSSEVLVDLQSAFRGAQICIASYGSQQSRAGWARSSGDVNSQ